MKLGDLIVPVAILGGGYFIYSAAKKPIETIAEIPKEIVKVVEKVVEVPAKIISDIGAVQSTTHLGAPKKEWVVGGKETPIEYAINGTADFLNRNVAKPLGDLFGGLKFW